MRELYCRDQLEGELDQLEAKQRPLYDEEAKEVRKEAYNNISIINNKLNTMEEELKETAEKLSSQAETKEMDSTRAGVLEIMSNQQL